MHNPSIVPLGKDIAISDVLESNPAELDGNQTDRNKICGFVDAMDGLAIPETDDLAVDEQSIVSRAGGYFLFAFDGNGIWPRPAPKRSWGSWRKKLHDACRVARGAWNSACRFKARICRACLRTGPGSPDPESLRCVEGQLACQIPDPRRGIPDFRPRQQLQRFRFRVVGPPGPILGVLGHRAGTSKWQPDGERLADQRCVILRQWLIARYGVGRSRKRA